MTPPRPHTIATLLLAILPTLACSTPRANDAVYQIAPLKSLLEGVYDGSTPLSQALARGDFGLATVNPLDGEVIVLDGRPYRAGTDLRAAPLDPARRTPFAVVKRFRADATVPLRDVASFASLGQLLDARARTLNVVHAVRVDGQVDYLKLRSVPAQSPPFARLSDVIRGQSVGEFTNLRGTLVGFRFPTYLAGVNATGYHFHFISDDRTTGGHVLDVRAAALTATVDYAEALTLVMPADDAFRQADLRTRESDELLRLVQPPATTLPADGR